MIKWILIMVFFAFSFAAIAQDFEDAEIIYPYKSETIFPDKIIKIHKKKIVEFVIDGDTLLIKAKAIVVHGTYVDLNIMIKAVHYIPEISLDSAAKLNYNGKNYLHYLQLYTRSKKPFKTGLTLSIIGVGVTGLGSMLYITGIQKHDKYSYQQSFGSLFMIAGGITLSVGLPFLITGSSLKINNKRAMEECRKPKKYSLNFGVNQHGLGMALRF